MGRFQLGGLDDAVFQSVPVPVLQVAYLDPAHSANRPLPPLAPALDLVQQVARRRACLATLELAPQADFSQIRTMHSVPTNPLLFQVRPLIFVLLS